MRAVLLLILLSSCGVLSSWMTHAPWLAARVEPEIMAVQTHYRPVNAMTPTPFALPQPVLSVGMRVRVQMLENEWLNLRSFPSTQGEVIAMLRDGTWLTLLEGPIERDGYRWWRVQVSGREGWCVEQAGDVLAITLPPTATPG